MALGTGMPLGEEHRRNRAKNYVLGGILLAVVVVFFVITVLRLGGGS